VRKTIYYYIADHVFAVESEKMDCFMEQFKSGIPFLKAVSVNDDILFTMSLDETLSDWGMVSLPEWEINDLCRFEYEHSTCVFSRYKKRIPFSDGLFKRQRTFVDDERQSYFLFSHKLFHAKTYRYYRI
jgi:hypothetical protein